MDLAEFKSLTNPESSTTLNSIHHRFEWHRQVNFPTWDCLKERSLPRKLMVYIYMYVYIQWFSPFTGLLPTPRYKPVENYLRGYNLPLLQWSNPNNISPVMCLCSPMFTPLTTSSFPTWFPMIFPLYSNSGFWVILLMGFLAVSPLQRKPWKIHINPFATPRNFLGILQVAEFCLGGHLWDFYGIFMRFLWDFCGIWWDFIGIFMDCVPGWPKSWIFMGFLWDFKGFYWDFYAMCSWVTPKVGFLWDFSRIFMGLLWEFYGIAVGIWGFNEDSFGNLQGFSRYSLGNFRNL